MIWHWPYKNHKNDRNIPKLDQLAHRIKYYGLSQMRFLILIMSEKIYDFYMPMKFWKKYLWNRKNIYKKMRRMAVGPMV